MTTGSGPVRMPAVAGMFYPEDPPQCRHEVQRMFAKAMAPLAGNWKGALLPHAGWVCSGQLAADGIVSMRKANASPDVIVIFGAVHTIGGFRYGALDDHEAWHLPTGQAQIALEIQNEVLASSDRIRVDPRVHRREHAIEVQLPLVQHAWPGVPVLPIEVPPVEGAEEIGREAAALLRAANLNALYLASSDLTHYGPNYGLVAVGVGQQALAWAAENDARLLRLIHEMRGSEIVDETSQNRNACGGGAIAALLGACAELGATVGHTLRHTNSYDVLSAAIGRQRADNFVGYAAALVG